MRDFSPANFVSLLEPRAGYPLPYPLPPSEINRCELSRFDHCLLSALSAFSARILELVVWVFNAAALFTSTNEEYCTPKRFYLFRFLVSVSVPV